MGFDPVERLNSLLGPSPAEPWAALIPQILLWCFRRFCIQKLIESEGMLSESLWDDHHHLVHMYCPKGLESTSISWLTPENIEKMHRPSEEYNKFFLEFISYFDSAITSEDYETQDILSEFLDTKICSIINTWLDSSPFSIFPMDITEDDTFTENKFTSLINALLLHGEQQEEEQEEEQEGEQEEEQEQEQEDQEEEEGQTRKSPPPKEPEPDKPYSASFLLWQYLMPPPLIPQYLLSSSSNSEVYTVEPPAIDLPPHITVNAKSVKTVSRAMAYRRTIRKSRQFKTSRVKTHRSHPTT